MADTDTESSGSELQTGVDSSSRFDTSEKLVISAVILLHLAVTVFLAYKLNIWVDEAFSLRTTERGVGYALRQALHFELQAPLYFVLLSVWRKLDSSVFFARLFSVASVALSLRVIAGLSRRLWNDVHPGWIVAIVAFNPLTIGVAVDVRLYAPVLLLSSLLLLTLYDGYLTKSTSRRAQIYHLILAVIALYTQYYTGFLLAGMACVLLVLRQWRPLRQYLVGMVVVAVCFTPMLPFLRYQMSAHTAPISNAESWFEILKFITWRMKDYLLPLGWDITLEIRSWLLRVCYVVALFIVFKNRRNLSSDAIAMWTVTLVVALCFLVTARLSGESLLQVRHTAILFLPITLAAFSIAVLQKNKKLILCWTLVAMVFSLTSLYRYYSPVAKPGDWLRVAEYVMTREKPEQTIIVFHAGAALPLAHYYKGRNSLVPIPRENTFDRFDFSDYILRDEREIIQAIERTPGNHDTIWLVTDDDCGYADLSYHCEILEEYVNKNFTVEESSNFRNSTVRLLRRK